MKPFSRMTALVLAAVGLLAGPAQAREAPSAAPADLQALGATIQRTMDESGIVGVGAAILVDRKVVWTQGYGWADRERALPFTPDTVMNIASISKTVTGVAMMRAVQDGRLDLDADINRYLPFKVVNPHVPAATITLRQLATHTSGITDRASVYRASYRYGDDAQPESLGAFLRNYLVRGGTHYAAENFLAARPGTEREYSNIGAGLAGHIVEQAAGQSLADYTRQVVFDPLGMRNTGWSMRGMDDRTHATLYAGQHGSVAPIAHYEAATYPDGGLRTSVADLSRLFAALLNDGAYDGVRILDEGIAREMLRFQFTKTRKPDNVDLTQKNSGLFWQSKYDVTRMGHGGTDIGLSTEMLASLSRDVGVVVFANTSLSGEDGVAHVRIFQALWKQAEAMKAAAPRGQQPGSVTGSCGLVGINAPYADSAPTTAVTSRADAAHSPRGSSPCPRR